MASLDGARLNVFVNCPYDIAYRPVFRAIVFAIHDCGGIARSGLEVTDSADPRLQKILRLIGECQLGIHDISRTELDPQTKLPRFNMPLELGLHLGARHFGGAAHRRKGCLVLDRSPTRYVKFISDIRGLDIAAHADQPKRAVTAVRDWLDSHSKAMLPDGKVIADRLATFNRELPAICAANSLRLESLSFKNHMQLVARWLMLNPLQRMAGENPQPRT